MTSNTFKRQHPKRPQLSWVMCAYSRTSCDAVMHRIAAPPSGR